MDTTTTTAPTGKRARNGSVILTDRLCEKRVARRIKVYDRKCPGLYVSVIPAGVATFNFKFTDPTTGKQRSTVLGVYNPETFTTEDARSKVYALKALDPTALVEQLRRTEAEGQAWQDRRGDHRTADRLDAASRREGRRRDAAPDRKLGERRQPFAAFRQIEPRQQDRKRRDAGRYRKTHERHP
jgi:hypothetical protein